ncbi:MULTISPECIES: hypothetical protein [unclassified Streptomyces]|uniref:hypothetical protein n=1 Tax=unclassified Streptomyces TaxID=2593676 RepID=UPI0004CA535D|nr:MULTISPECIES: hypothetical protein [unclassified Streptomyces]
MGTYRQTVVDLDASAEEAVAWGRRGRNWLEAEGFIRPVPWQDGVVYLAGPRWRETVDLAPWDWRARIKELEEEPGDELQVVTGRTVFFAGQGDFPSAICPRCRNATSDTDRSGAAIDTWYATGAADLDCPACAHRTPLPDWEWTSDYFAFAYLGFQFDDWPPLHPRFVAVFGQALGHRVRVVTGKI